MYPYEGMFLLDPVAHAADPEGVEKGVSALLQKHGAKIHQFAKWDERKLAYEVKGHRRGVYLLAHFEMPLDGVDGFRKEARITETILRNLIVRLDRDIAAHLEMSARYYDKMKADAENRRTERFGRPREDDVDLAGEIDERTMEEEGGRY
ncbi:MAG: 30S ribosomal protein S6 [Planctomycetota bacterium]